MKVSFLLLAGVALSTLGTNRAEAAEFVLSQKFDAGQENVTGTPVPPPVLTGTFSGTRNGNVITNLSNISLFLNGVAFNGNGNLYTARYGLAGFYGSGTGQLSLDNTANNAIIIDADYANGARNYSNYFYSLPGFGDFATSAAVFGTNERSSNLVIQEVGAVGAVPEPATWAMMLMGFGLVGFGLRSRRKPSVRVTYA